MLIICQKDSFHELLTRTMSESLILFDQKFYKQHDGVAMIHQEIDKLKTIFENNGNPKVLLISVSKST